MKSDTILIKLKKNQKYYPRKLTNSLIHDYSFQGIVNKTNELIGVNWDCTYFIINPNKCPSFFKTESGLTLKGFDKKYSEENTLYLYNCTNFKPLLKPIPLSKSVKGVRYAQHKEETLVKDSIVDILSNNTPFEFKEVLYQSKRYSDCYSECIRLDLLENFFKKC